MRRNSIDCLSPDVRKAVRKALYARGFRDYAGCQGKRTAKRGNDRRRNAPGM